MPDDDALSAAIEQLYSTDPDEFMSRRAALAAQARQSGDATAAGAITGLRRPTKAAWTINRLVRAQPDVAAGLADLGAQLRAAQRALDGARLRELTQQRRKLIDSATRKAFELSGSAGPSGTLRNEVASTFEAALADPEVAEQLATATLVRSAEWSGFGDSVPALSAVPPLRERSRSAKTAKSPGPGARAAPERAGATKPDAAQRQRDKVSAAEDALAHATDEVAAAAEAQAEREHQVALLAEQLADARRRVDESKLDARQARSRQRGAERRLDRARR